MKRVACMTDDEHRIWRAGNDSQAQWRAKSPCEDCIASFAVEMRSEGRCDGIPLGWEDDEPMAPSVKGHAEAVAASSALRSARRLRRVEQAAMLHGQGRTPYEIADLMGVTPSAVYDWLQEARRAA